MRNGDLRKWAVLTILLSAGSSASAQVPDKFTNLKVLPKEITKHEMEATMRSFAFALGVRCDHCQVEKKAPERGFDFAADDKDMPGLAAANEASRSATWPSNRTGVAARLAMTTS